MRSQIHTQGRPLPPPPPPPRPAPAASAGRTSSPFAQRMSQRRKTSEPQPKSPGKEPKKTDKPKDKAGARKQPLMRDPLDSLQRHLMCGMPPMLSKAGPAAQSLSASSLSAAGGPQFSSAALQQIVDRVAVGVQDSGAAMFHVELKGDVLDGLKVQVKAGLDGKVSVHFLSENEQVRKLLDENSQRLQKALKEKGIVLDALETHDPKERQRQRKRQQNQRDRESFCR